MKLLICMLLAAGTVDAASIEQRIEAMTDEEKIAQLLFIAVPSQVEDEALRELVGRWGVGGVVLYRNNVERPEQVRRLNAAILRNAENGTAPFIAIDQEGGIVHRLRHGVPIIPSAMALGATRSPELARRAGRAVGTALRGLGFTMNFAPVLDVLVDRDNAAIGTRAFSDEPNLVAEMGAAFIAGQREAGVIAVGKHFPGLGAVPDDPHEVLPRLDAPLDLLRRRDLVPFAAAFRGGLDAIMTAHLALPEITGKPDMPATLSPRIMRGLLREEMHFDGIAITDALQMDALARKRGAGALALDAIVAGSDMVLALGSAQERREVFDVLCAAYRDGRLPRQRVDEALRRILTVKDRLQRSPREVSDPTIAADVAARAVTLVPGSAPLPELPASGVIYIGAAGPLKELLTPDRAITFPDRMTAADVSTHYAKTRALARTARLCIGAARNRREFEILSRLRSDLPELPIVLVNLGSPWRILVGPRSSTLLTYAEDATSQTAAARVLLGKARPMGVAPVGVLDEEAQGRDPSSAEKRR